VFLLMRMREGWLRARDVREGIDFGLARTARVVVGAAAIMAGVFLSFTTAEVTTIRQLGFGLAIAVVIDATVVRLVLLPAALRVAAAPRRSRSAAERCGLGAERRLTRCCIHPAVPASPTAPSAMRSFDPRRVGELECAAWVAYYRRDWLALLRAAVPLTHHTF